MSAAVNRAEAYQLFSAAMDVEPGSRDAFVWERCGDRLDLLREVAALLAVAASDAGATGILLGGAERPVRDLTGREYGQFRLLELIGAGGMGVIYRAERTDGVPQAVAIKLLRGEINAAGSERFVREAKILARLEHPAIARLIDVDVREGEGWIALELVRGRPIDEYCERRHLSLRERIGLLVVVADAVSTAHRMLIVHRDIKPTNVLVNEDGQPKLIDFGIASALSNSSEPRESTADVRRLFTPHYAAPEQVKGEPVTVGTDVFGLGALAYRLLSGRAPYAGVTGAVGYLFAVTHQDIEPPSRAAVAAGMDLRQARRLRGDLDAILMKALERDPARRYASARDLQVDLERYLGGLPVGARAQTVGYRLVKFARRRALAAILFSLLLLGLIAGGVIYGLQARSVAQARDGAARRGEFLENLLKSADPNNGRRDITVAELLDSAAGELDRKLSGEPLVEASMLGLIAQTNFGLGRYPQGHTANDWQLAILRAHGGSALQIGQALLLRGQLLRADGQWAESEAVLHEAVARLRLLNDPADLCAALDNLAVATMQLRREPEAEAILREEIAIESRGDQALRTQRMNPYYVLAVLLGGDLGRYAEAERYGRSAWELAVQNLATDSPDRLIMENAYAVTLRNTQRAAEAEPLFRDVVARQTRILGAAHHDTLLSQLTLADDLIDLHRDSEASSIALTAARQLGPLLGAENQYALMAWNEYGTAACHIHQEEAGLAALRNVEAVRRRTLPAGHRLIFSVATSIGVCLTQQHRYAEAESTLLAAAAGLEAARGPGYRLTQDAFSALRDLYAAMNRPEQAARWAAKLIT